MGKVTVEDLHRIKKETWGRIALRKQEANARITVHMGECGMEAGARDVMKTLLEQIGASGRQDVHIFTGDCLGICETEPNVTVEIKEHEPVVYQKVDQEKARLIFDRHVMSGEILQEDVVAVPAAEEIESEAGREE
ncbi:MAG: (2Fe-2S) ferredoxin domain-containing protein [Desulfobacterales bacterium]